MPEDRRDNPKNEHERNFQSLPIVGGHIREVNSQIPRKGLPLALKDFFENHGVHISAEYSGGALEALQNDPVLVVASHPDIMNDTMGLLASLPSNRKDVSVVMSSLLLKMGGSFTEHVIPIYNVQPVGTKAIRMLLRRVGMDEKKLPTLQAAKKNVQSLRVVRKKITEGGLVVFFPDGGKKDNEPWQNGIGELIDQLKDTPNTKIVFAEVEGSKWRNRARIFSSKARRISRKTDLKVSFSEPHSINEYAADSSRQTITQTLKNQYDTFTHLKR